MPAGGLAGLTSYRERQEKQEKIKDFKIKVGFTKHPYKSAKIRPQIRAIRDQAFGWAFLNTSFSFSMVLWV